MDSRLLTAIFTSIIAISSILTATTNSDLCSSYTQPPVNQSWPIGNEKTCQFSTGADLCSTCCSNHSSVCCDDGSCMEFDQFCRYPKSCCAKDYCGDQCCSPAIGVPCGPICAPKQNFQCCNESAGFMCAKPDFCCNGALCCTQDKHCCDSNICCAQGEECCQDKCCRQDETCVGNGQCCPQGSVGVPNGGCCPIGQTCANVTNGCCGPNTHCADNANVCCFNDQTGCGNTCCSSDYICCDGKCCPSEFGCVADGCCPPVQACGPDNCCSEGNLCCENSPTHHCCPRGMLCCNDHCCPANTNYCGPDGECCPSGSVVCDDICCPTNIMHCNENQECIGNEEPVNKRDISSSFISIIRTMRFIELSKEEQSRENRIVAAQLVDLPPPPTQKVNPRSYPCFNDTVVMNSTCDAFACLEEIASCGINGFILNQRKLYCDDFDALTNLFNPAGQQFLNCTGKCVTDDHIQMFDHGFKPCCGSMELWAQSDGVSDRNNCMTLCNFCNLYLTNIVGFDALLDLLQPNTPPLTFYNELCSG